MIHIYYSGMMAPLIDKASRSSSREDTAHGAVFDTEEIQQLAMTALYHQYNACMIELSINRNSIHGLSSKTGQKN